MVCLGRCQQLRTGALHRGKRTDRGFWNLSIVSYFDKIRIQNVSLAMSICQVTMDRVRRLSDQSNGLQGFLIFHSFGGLWQLGEQNQSSMSALRWNRLRLCITSHGASLHRLWQKIQASILHLSGPSGFYQSLNNKRSIFTGVNVYRRTLQRRAVHAHHPGALRLRLPGGQPGHL